VATVAATVFTTGLKATGADANAMTPDSKKAL